jgi:flagellar basal-body rod modification protein FlgD
MGMSTTGIGSTSAAGSNAALQNSKYNLKTEDFINMMVTQLQNQDPMDPAKNSDLLAQMSQIGQLQSSTDLQSTLKSIMSQSQISSAGALIGKSVTGTLSDGKTSVTGLVESVRVVDGTANLQLENGAVVPLANVSAIDGAAAATGA